jgi:heptosyltransferase-2
LKKFLIINPFGIGDCLFTTPVIMAIKDAYPDSFIGYWCNERVRDIFKNDPAINRIFALSRGDLKRKFNESAFRGIKSFFNLISGIKREKFDAAFDFSLDHRYGLITKLLGVKKRVGFNYKGRGLFLTDKLELSGYEGKHIIEYYLDLLKFAGINAETGNLYLSVQESSKLKNKMLLKRSGIQDNDLVIGIAPGAGASWGKDAFLKHWPTIKFSQLADKLSSELGAKVVILGDESEKPISDAIVNMMKNKPLDLTGKIALEDLAGLIMNLRILITNDGGPLHMAVALGVKTVSIFGPVDDLVYGPYPASPSHIVIKSDLTCRPCYKNFRLNPCAQERECLKLISVEEVFNAAANLL